MKTRGVEMNLHFLTPMLYLPLNHPNHVLINPNTSKKTSHQLTIIMKHYQAAGFIQEVGRVITYTFRPEYPFYRLGNWVCMVLFYVVAAPPQLWPDLWFLPPTARYRSQDALGARGEVQGDRRDAQGVEAAVWCTEEPDLLHRNCQSETGKTVFVVSHCFR